jgi:hypothetical protein
VETDDGQLPGRQSCGELPGLLLLRAPLPPRAKAPSSRPYPSLILTSRSRAPSRESRSLPPRPVSNASVFGKTRTRSEPLRTRCSVVTMSNAMRICLGANGERCGERVPQAPGRCPRHHEMHRRQRAEQMKASGRATHHWAKLRGKVMRGWGGQCRVCGAPAEHVHLDPRLNGDHRRATIDDCVPLCVRCHGEVHRKV